jgi:hypothetical protein
MNTHRQIMVAMGEAVRDSEAVRAYCVDNFGRGLAVHICAYAAAIPGEGDAPFLWIYPEPIDDELKNADKTFAVHCIVGCCVKGKNGEKKIAETVTPRTATANGLTISGAGDTVDALRALCIAAIRAKQCGAIQTRVAQTEADISHLPLEWAEFLFEFTEFEAL